MKQLKLLSTIYESEMENNSEHYSGETKRSWTEMFFFVFFSIYQRHETITTATLSVTEPLLVCALEFWSANQIVRLSVSHPFSENGSYLTFTQGNVVAPISVLERCCHEINVNLLGVAWPYQSSQLGGNDVTDKQELNFSQPT